MVESGKLATEEQVWHPVFDKERVASIGALAIAPSDSNVVYVGTGEQTRGNGVYRSTDAGATWKNVGLRDVPFIQAIIIENRKMGTQGYCMGGAMAFRTAYAVPDRVGAVASFHGGNGLVTTMPDSPHLQAATTKAQFLVAIAENDDMQAPTEKTVMKETFAKAGLPAEIEVYAAMHGWCPPDSGVYSEPQAEKAWSRLLVLYEKALA